MSFITKAAILCLVVLLSVYLSTVQSKSVSSLREQEEYALPEFQEQDAYENGLTEDYNQEKRALAEIKARRAAWEIKRAKGRCRAGFWCGKRKRSIPAAEE